MIVGLSGFAGSGKDAAAEALTSMGWRRDAFADRLREILFALNPIVHVELEMRGNSVNAVAYRVAELVDEHGWDSVKRTYPEVRSLLQRLGTDAGRKVLGDSIWVDLVLLEYDGTEPLVITDCRFRNEADAIRNLGGLVIRINRPGVGPNTAPDGSVHVSDVALDGYEFDHVINNNGTLEQLHLAMRMLVQGDFDNLAASAA